MLVHRQCLREKVHTRGPDYRNMPSTLRAPPPQGLEPELAEKTCSTSKTMYAPRSLWARDYIGRDRSSCYCTTRGTHRSCPLIDSDKRRPSPVLKAAHRDAVRVFWPKRLSRYLISSDVHDLSLMISGLPPATSRPDLTARIAMLCSMSSIFFN